MRKLPIQIEDCSKVELHIHVLGYSPKGESILIVLWDNYDKVVLRSIMIDSYEKNGKNEMSEILNHYGLDTKKLDFLVWTHPDLDHSLGIPKIIKGYSSSKTLILLPVGFKMEIFKSLDSTLFKTAHSVIRKSRQDKDTVVQVSTSGLYSNTPTIQDKYKDGINDGFNFSIEILAPFSESSFRWTEVLKNFNKNDISIAFNICFGHYRFFFGGDSMNDALMKIDEYKMINTMFVKVPHHGSPTSGKLPERYMNVAKKSKGDIRHIMTVVTTTYEDYHTKLPNHNVLDKYKCFLKKILHTSNPERVNDYGICSFVYKYNSCVPNYSYKGDTSVYYEFKKVAARCYTE